MATTDKEGEEVDPEAGPANNKKWRKHRHEQHPDVSENDQGSGLKNGYWHFDILPHARHADKEEDE